MEADGHELRLRYAGRPASAPALDTLVDAAVRLAVNPQDM